MRASEDTSHSIILVRINWVCRKCERFRNHPASFFLKSEVYNILNNDAKCLVCLFFYSKGLKWERFVNFLFTEPFVSFVERPKRKSKPYNFWVNLITKEHPWQDFEKEQRHAIRQLINTAPALLFLIILVLYSCIDLPDRVSIAWEWIFLCLSFYVIKLCLSGSISSAYISS